MAKRRKRGDGGVSLRKDGRWEGRVVIGYDASGKPRTKNVLAKTKTECVAKLKTLKETIMPPTPEVPKAGMTFGQWLDFWYQTFKKPTLRPKTQVDYEGGIYQHIIPGVGDIPLTRLSQDDLQKFYKHLKEHGRLCRTELYGEGLSDRMVRFCHTACRLALQKAAEDGLIPGNPADGCVVPVGKPKEMLILTPEEMLRLFIQAKYEGFFELLLLELTTGMRRGELLALQWDDLDLETGELRIWQQVQRVKGELAFSEPKTAASSRGIILSTPVLEALRQYRTTVMSRWMFPSPVKEDRPRDPTAVRKRLSILLERAACKHVRFHDLRHTFASVALEQGMDIKTLSMIIGHVSAHTTLNVYAHVTDNMRKSAAAKIDKSIGGGTGELPEELRSPPRTDFQPTKGKYRKRGTGCVTQINDHLWEGRWSPKVNGKRISKNVYAATEQECEAKLAELIAQMKATA